LDSGVPFTNLPLVSEVGELVLVKGWCVPPQTGFSFVAVPSSRFSLDHR
jgi:hypothetical protein